MIESIMKVYAWFQANLGNITEVIAYIIAGASIIVKMTPTLKDDDALKGVIKFIGKYLALDKYSPKGEE
jgi:SepF-like predicted cell division protein (DUF552 family)